MRAEMGKDPSRAPPSQLNLPPGFRFYPTDEELVVHYLCKKAALEPFAVPIIAEIELYKFDPWDLPEKALFGEKEWYFFSPRDRKYPNGSRPNRAAGSGYWKATGTDKPIHTLSGSMKVGVKKALVFYRGKAPKGVKTNWIMHEYRLADSAARSAKRKGTLRLDDWVLCRIYKKCSSSTQKAAMAAKEHSESSCLDNVLSPVMAVHGETNRLSPSLESIREDLLVDDKRTVSLQTLYQNPTYMQQVQGRYDSAPTNQTPGNRHGSGTPTNEQQRQATSFGDVSSADSPSNVYSGRHMSEGLGHVDDAAESTCKRSLILHAFPQSLYNGGQLDVGGLLPSPTSAMLGQAASFSTLLEADYVSTPFFCSSSSDFNLHMRPFSRGSHSMAYNG